VIVMIGREMGDIGGMIGIAIEGGTIVIDWHS